MGPRNTWNSVTQGRLSLEVSGGDAASCRVPLERRSSHAPSSGHCLLGLVCVSIATWLLAGVVHAEDKSLPGERVELFAAMEAHQVDVQLIPKNAKQATVIIRNRTDKPLSIQLPEAFAGLPVLAQNNNAGGGNPTVTSAAAVATTITTPIRALAAAWGWAWGWVAWAWAAASSTSGPTVSASCKVQTVCLEHGKEDPNPACPLRTPADHQLHPEVRPD